MHLRLVRFVFAASLAQSCYCTSVYLCNMGVAELMQWGVPAALILLHMHLLATNGLEDSQVKSSVFATSFTQSFLTFAFLRPMILLNFSLVKAKLAVNCARPVPKRNHYITVVFKNILAIESFLPRQNLLVCKWTKT